MQPAPDSPGVAPPASPSAWVRRWSHLIGPQAHVLDLACGSGRHVRWFAQRGCRVTAVDRDARAVRDLAGSSEVIVADLEAGPWPLAQRRFDAIVVTNYLWRPTWPQLLANLGPGGVLLYETFSAGHERLGRPSNPDFLLRTGELLTLAQGLRVVAFEDGFEPDPARQVQRIVALRAGGSPDEPPRYPLTDSMPSRRQVKSGDTEESA